MQLDEPWLQARAEAARRYGVKAINRALAGVRGTTALHLCFGYAALVKDKPSSGYSFLAELEDSAAHQISIEAAQPKLDLAVLRALQSKTVLVGVLDLERTQRRDAAASRDADPRGARRRAGGAPRRDARLRHEYLPRDVAFGKLKALADGASWCAPSSDEARQRKSRNLVVPAFPRSTSLRAWDPKRIPRHPPLNRQKKLYWNVTPYSRGRPR